jgi:hypothetical protein
VATILILGMLVVSNHGYAQTSPQVKLIDSNSHPLLPQGPVEQEWQLPDLKAGCKAGPEDNVYSKCPILEWNGFTYWPFSYKDNRMGLNIVQYDESGNVIEQWAKNDARYAVDITVDENAKTVTFWGADGNTIEMSWDELSSSAEDYTPPPVIDSPDDTDSKIPSWIKDVMRFYINGQVSEEEMLNAIKYLIQQDIIVL